MFSSRRDDTVRAGGTEDEAGSGRRPPLGFAVKVMGQPDLKSNDARRWASDPHLKVSLEYVDGILDYLDQLTRNLKLLGAYRNLLLAGRSGRFWYNNMDHSIGQGLTMADKILRGEVLAEIDSADREFWATEEDGNVPVRAEEIAEPPEDPPGRT